MQVGPYILHNRLAVAPMAGVTDRPFRQLCKMLGAGYAVSEMTASDTRLWNTDKSRRRRDHDGEVAPIAVQIAGTEPVQMAEAARLNVAHGAQIIDINMGCPAKKVCNVLAGSALLRDEAKVGAILDAVVAAAGVPVTLKIRTGWDREHRNAVSVARIAETAGIRALVVHGRTRADLYNGTAEYDTIAEVKAAVGIPVIANGDIDSPEKAGQVLHQTGADAVMIGRAALGRPWIFREMDHYLQTGRKLAPPDLTEVREILLAHVGALHAFYGEHTGPKVVRKHVGWYAESIPGGQQLRAQVNGLGDAQAQLEALAHFFDGLADSACVTAVEQRLAA
ncbi:MAG: tRNA dihydrouridine synthase DusB [Burkholderiales bacterium]|nr:tRNA dihydrouridine synthase DusB [Burkholderiales bacterium]